MKLYIPDINDKLKLTKPWTFRLYHEMRNDKLFELLFKDDDWWEEEDDTFRMATLPKDQILTVDRIYIRKGNKEYSSVSFRVPKARFWAKLDDVNQIECEIVT